MKVALTIDALLSLVVTYVAHSEIRFGRRGVAAPAPQVNAEDMRRGVAALDALSRPYRRDPAARATSLFYALRSRAGRVPIETLVRLVDARIAAFEWMLANRPHLISRESATAAFEAEVYEAIATEPLIVTHGHARFDEARFLARVARSASRKSAAGGVREYQPPG